MFANLYNFLDPGLSVRKIRQEPPTWEEVLSSNLINEITKKVISYSRNSFGLLKNSIPYGRLARFALKIMASIIFSAMTDRHLSFLK